MKDKWAVMVISFFAAILFYLAFYDKIGSRLDEMLMFAALFGMITIPNFFYGKFVDRRNG